jgi:hypothetical protein
LRAPFDPATIEILRGDSKIAALRRFVLIVVAALTAVVGATVPAQAATDLSSLLADAPGFDWREASGSNQDVIEGPFTAKSYGDFVDRSRGTPGSTASVLQDYGFNGGYGKVWQQFGSHDLLVERVFQFDSDSGATSWYNDIKSGTESETWNQGTIPAAAAIPDSFSAILVDPTFPKQWRVDFLKSNLVFVVHTDSNTNDLASLAVSQAQKEYSNAPTSTVHLSTNPQTPAWVMPVMYGVAAALLIFLVGVVAVALLVSRRRTPAVAGASIQLSVDGAFWWDGVRWHDARTEIPPHAQRSPDGVYWWDGRSWRRPGS